MRKNLLSAIAATLLVGVLQAQDVACKINNYTIHTGFKGSEMPIHGLEVGYIQHLGKMIDMYLPVRLGPRGDVKKTLNSETTKTQLMGTAALDIAIQAKYDNGHNFLIPFISTGFGAELYHNGLEFGAPIGGGLNFRITPKVLVSLASSYRVPLTKTSPEGFCHSLGVIVNLKNKESLSEKPFVSKLPAIKTNSSDEYTRLEAEAKAAKEAETVAKANKEAQAKKQAEALAKATEEVWAKKQIELAAQAEAQERAKMEATKPVVVSTEVQEVLNVALKGVQFELGSAQLTEASYPVLDEVASTMAKNPNLRISIEGHTDRTGNESINMKLSESRAKVCLTYLISKGVDTARLKESGFGSTHPVADNDTPEGQIMNRRVEFIPF